MHGIEMWQIRRWYRDRNPAGHWFDADTMRFFRSRLAQTGYTACDVWDGGPAYGRHPTAPIFFVSSEQGPDGVRRWTVRRLDPDGAIETEGEFQGFRSRDAADRAARRFATVGVAA
jgi:hypothetical protein